MTIVAAYSAQNYAGDGSTTIFSTVFVFQLPADVSVHLLTNATQTTVAWVLGTDYTLSGGGSPAAVGAVTAVVPPALGTTLIISRVIPFTQLDHWQQNDAYPANSNRVENALDKITMALQEVTAGPISPSSLAPGTPSFSTFLRGDPLWTNTLIGPSGAVVLATDTTAVFTAEMNANASIRVGTGVGGQAGYSFAVDGSANPWEMKWVYDDGLGKMGWQVFGQSIRGTFDNTGLDVTGTVNATLFTGAADASLITTGTIATARLGSGSGSSNSFLNGLGQFTVPAGGGGGVNTTTTGTFTIAAVSSPQTVPVTSVTGITVGTYLQISDGAHTIIGHVTVISSLNLTVVTDSIAIGFAGNTMASGAAVQLSNVPGQNTIILSDHDNLATPISLITLTGGASDFSGLGIYNQVELYMITPPTGGQVPIRAGILRNALSATSFAGSENLTAGFVGFPTSATGASSLSSASAQYQVPFCSTFGGGKATGVTWGLVGPNNITPASLTPALLNVTNSLTDTQVFSYDSASGHFKMVPNNSTGSGTTAQFYRGDNTFTNSLTGPINIDLSSSTTFRIGVANIFGGSTPVQAYMEPVVSGTPTVLPLQIASQVALGGTQYNTIDTTNIIEMLQVNAIARATAFRSTCGPWLKIFELGTGGGATTIDLNNGNYQRFTSFGSNVTITLADTSPLPTAQRFTSELTLEFNAMSTFDVTWPGTITWANGGVGPTVANSGLTAAGINVVKLIRRQGQTQWVGFVENPEASTPYTDAQARSAVLNSTYLLPASDGSITWSIVAGTSASPTVPTSGIKDIHISPPTGGGTGIAPTKLTGTGVGLTTNFLRQDGSWQPPPGGGGGGQVPIQMSLGGSTSGMPGVGLVSGIDLTASTGMTISKSIFGSTGVKYTLSSSGSGALPFYYVAVPSSNATTDTTNISNAISTAASAGGGIVVLQAGTYQINSTITLNSDNVSIIGAGSGQIDGSGALPSTGTRLLWTGATLTGAMFSSTTAGGPQGCRFEGFSVFGGTVVTAQKAIGMRFAGLHHSSFRDMAFANFSGIALDLYSASGSSSILGPHNITIDNMSIDVGTLYWQAYNGMALSPSTAIGFRNESADGLGDVFACSFNNIEIVHNYIGVWMGNSDSNLFTNLHTFAFTNTTGPSTPRSPTVAGTPNPGVYVTDDSRLNRIVGCSTAIVCENIGGYPTHSAQCAVYDMDFIDAGSIAGQIYVGVGCELMVSNGSSLTSGTHAGTYYAGPNSGYTGTTHLYSVLFNDSTGLVTLTNRAGTITSF